MASTAAAQEDELDRVLRLFLSHSHDPELHTRHLAALAKLCRSASGSSASAGGGFAVRDLPRITAILRCTLQLVSGQHAQVFLEPACALIRAVGRPYVKQSSTDELRLLGIVSGLLQTVASVFATPQQLPAQLQVCTAEVLRDFASVWGNRPAPPPARSSPPPAELDLQSVQRVYLTHQTLLYQSQVVTAVCSALQRALNCSPHSTSSCSSQAKQQHQQPQEVGGDVAAGGLISALVSALLEFSYSPQLCEQLLQAGVLPLLAQLLLSEAQAGMTSTLSTQVIEILWNLFELAADTADQLAGADYNSNSSSLTTTQPGQEQQQQQQQERLTQQDGPRQLVDVLAVALQQQMATCTSLQRQQQRNDTLTVLYLLSQCSSFLHALTSSNPLMQLLLAAALPPAPTTDAAAAGGAGLRSSLNTPLNTTSSSSSSNSSSLEADHNMQLLAWSIFGSAAASCESAMVVFVQGGVLQLMLDAAAYGTTSAGAGQNSIVMQWLGRLAPEQLAASKQLAWSTLLQVSPLCKPSFCDCGGISLLLDSLVACGSSTASIGSTAWLSTAATATSPTGSLGRKSPTKGMNNNNSGSGGGKSSATCSSAEPVLRLLRGLVQADAAMSAAVVKQGCVAVLLQLLQAPAAATVTAVRQGVLLCLSELCSAGGRLAMTAVRQAEGVGMLLKECQSILEGDPYVPSLAALDALWRCCIPSNRSRAQLLAADGMDVLLSLLQRANPALRPVLLSVLADLLADTRAHAFFWEWHAPAAAGSSGWSSSSSSFSVPRARPPSGNGAAGALHSSTGRADSLTAGSSLLKGGSGYSSAGGTQGDGWLLACCSTGASARGIAGAAGGAGSITAVQLLVSIWRHQDAALGISGPDGTIANPSRPLAGCGSSGGGGGLGRTTAGAVRVSSAGSGHQVDAYGLMLPGRQLVLERMAEAGSPHSLMEKVYACFAALGVAGSTDASAVSPDGLSALQQLPPVDAATLAMIQRCTAFRQGEVWQDIRAGFQAEGLQVTQEDSMRLESGIQHAEMVAAQVQAAQAVLLGAEASHQLAVERIIYDNMAAQAAADAAAKVYEKDSSKLTMKERLAAKARKEDMLARSCAVAGTGSGTATAAGGVEQ